MARRLYTARVTSVPAGAGYEDDANAEPRRNAVAAWLAEHRFALRRLHSLTGVVFGGYIVVHLLINATLLQSALPFIFGVEHDVYQAQVDVIHNTPFLVAVEWTAIYLPILFHGIYGILVAVSGRPNAGSYAYGKNWAYTAQRATSFILLAFILFHVLTMKGVFANVGETGRMLTFVPKGFATASAVNHMQAAWWVGYLIYPIGILAATFHLANGFWTAGITWGLTITKRAQHLWGLACVGLFVFTTLCGFGSLAATLAAPTTPLGMLQSEYVDPAPSAPLSPSNLIEQAIEEPLQDGE